MRFKISSSIIILILSAFLPFKVWAIYQICPSSSASIQAKKEFLKQKKFNSKTIAFVLLKKHIIKSDFKNNDAVKKKVDGFAIASIILAFSILISTSLGVAILLLALSLAAGLISIIRISQKLRKEGESFLPF